jgi:hypothetical protein
MLAVEVLGRVLDRRINVHVEVQRHKVGTVEASGLNTVVDAASNFDLPLRKVLAYEAKPSKVYEPFG